MPGQMRCLHMVGESFLSGLKPFLLNNTFTFQIFYYFNKRDS